MTRGRRARTVKETSRERQDSGHRGEVVAIDGAPRLELRPGRRDRALRRHALPRPPWPKAIADMPTCRAVWDVVAPLAGIEGFTA